MSHTRHAPAGSPLRQEKWASSQELDRGLMANLVAKRAALLSRAEDCALIWFLQFLSWMDGGLKQVALDLTQHFPQRVATPAMQKLGCNPGQIYRAKQVREVRGELLAAHRDCDLDECFLLKGELSFGERRLPREIEDRDYVDSADADEVEVRRRPNPALLKARAASQRRPSTYPAAAFFQICRQAAEENLERHLSELCLNPALPIADGAPWYFPSLISTLREFQSQWIKAKSEAAVVTSVGAKVGAALDYALASRRLVLIDGVARIGKTFAAQAWCQAHPGQARYFQVPSTNDEKSFFRALAKVLGVGASLNYKVQDIRARVEETLQSGQLMLLADESHFLWPQSSDPRALPGRVSWLMTALINHGVPVALIITPQFFRSQQVVEKYAAWNSEQFVGRIGHYEKLPASLSEADLASVARSLLPEGDARSIEALVAYAQASAKYLAGIDATISRARYLARQEQRESLTFADIKRAIRESVIPSDAALACAMGTAKAPTAKRAAKVLVLPVPDRFTPPDSPPRALGPALPSNRIPSLVPA